MLSKIFYKATLQNDHKGFLEDVEVRLIDRHKVLTPLSENITL